MRRTIQAPGIELRETDNSAYNKQDYSIVGTTSLVCGFASKGENYNINWINTLQNFEDTYGQPQTEEEKFFYNAAYEVLKKGGIFLGARLPYDNVSRDNFTYVDYELSSNVMNLNSSDSPLSSVHQVDSTMNKAVVLNCKSSGLLTLQELDNHKVNKQTVAKNTFRIVDLTKSQYDECTIVNVDIEQATSITSAECLGIVPVVVTPINAMFYQGMISSQTAAITNPNTGAYAYEKTTELSTYTPLVDFTTIGSTESKNYDVENYVMPIDSASINDNTVAKQAVSYFPTMSFIDQHTIDNEYLKQIGIVVFKMYNANTSSSRAKIAFKPVEAFVGSLDKNAKNSRGATIFIDNVINQSSQYINVFSNCTNWKSYDNTLTLKDIDTYYIGRQTAISLGFTKTQCKKTIQTKTSIIDALNIIFDKAQDKNTYYIDIVTDAGVSNIAQKYSIGSSTQSGDDIEWPRPSDFINSSSCSIWKSVLNKFTTFCSNTRKDCMFIADGFRPFCLDGDQKIVRSTSITNTVSNQVIPKLKYMTGVNSSYAAGYCNWFLADDAFSGEKIWLPPSIKMTGTYIYTDSYYNKWDAPAGTSRGKVADIVDCAFSPNADESEKIYLQSWNYAVNYPIDGIVVEGQKTFQIKATAFDRVNVRRLFLHLEKEVARIAKYFLYEGNTEYQRGRFVDSIRPIFENAVNKNGIVEYYIKCDSDNNTPQTIDNNELRCTIAVKPVKTIEFILLNFICTNQSASVTEAVQNS